MYIILLERLILLEVWGRHEQFREMHDKEFPVTIMRLLVLKALELHLVMMLVA